MFGQPPELELDEPLDPVDGVVAVELEDGVVVVVMLAEPELDPEPVAACVIAAAPPAIVPVTAIVAITLWRGMLMLVSLLSFVVVLPVNCRGL